MASILLVDDESGVRRLLRRCLEGLPHEVHEAESADADWLPRWLNSLERSSTTRASS